MDWTMRSSRFDAGFAAKLMPALRKHWRLTSLALLLAVAASGAFLVPAFHAGRMAAFVAPYPHEIAQVRFAVAGDVIPHEPVRAAAAAAAANGEAAETQGWGALFRWEEGRLG